MKTHHPISQISWTILILLEIVIFLPLYFLSYNVIYTEGEVMQGLFLILIFIFAGVSMLLALYSRRVAVFVMLGGGGMLLLWQSYQLRKWAMIQEEAVGIVRYAEKVAAATGGYPDSLKDHKFRHPDLRHHFERGYTTDHVNFRLAYFINEPGIGYWYESNGGFNYYPD